MITINEYLDDVLSDFKEYLASGVKLCELKNVHFDGGRVPDYSDIHIQQYYLLRFAYAYAFEYKCMYEYLFESQPLCNTIKTISIGCGTGIDYWSMVAALKDADLRHRNIEYTGIDLIDWDYKFPHRKRDKMDIYQGDAIDVFLKLNSLVWDIYFFPKSISEFSFDEIDLMCEAFQTKLIKQDKIYILVSIRSNDFNMQDDISKVAKFIKALKKANFHLVKGSDACLKITQEDKKIRELDDDFEHPFDVYNTLASLNEDCNQFQEKGHNCKDDCERRLTWKPILSCRQVIFQALTFERR
jgi:hypothetical protein